MNTQRVPLYQRAMEAIRQRIESGEYAPGAYIPSERELCDEFGVNRVTIRKSLELLAAEGLVEKRAGKGTRVVEASPAKAAATATPRYIAFVLCSSNRGGDRFTEPFQSDLFYHLERRCAERGYHLVYKTATLSDHIADIIQGLDVSYFVFSSQVYDHLLDEVKALGIPALIVNHQHPDFPSVQCDNFAAARDIVNHLVETGHRRIAVISGPSSYATSAERMAGWKSALRSAGLPYRDMTVCEGDWSFESGYDAGKTIAALPEESRPDAIFAFNDESAFGAIKALGDAGLSVPQDISIAGFDDVPACTQVTPALTTVHVDIATMATAIIQQLYFALEGGGETPAIQIMAPAWPMYRDSVRGRTGLRKGGTAS